MPKTIAHFRCYPFNFNKMDPDTICKSTQDVIQFIEATIKKAKETFKVY